MFVAIRRHMTASPAPSARRKKEAAGRRAGFSGEGQFVIDYYFAVFGPAHKAVASGYVHGKGGMFQEG